MTDGSAFQDPEKRTALRDGLADDLRVLQIERIHWRALRHYLLPILGDLSDYYHANPERPRPDWYDAFDVLLDATEIIIAERDAQAAAPPDSIDDIPF